MDIYFCDLCGVRVTDADLRAGHGINTNGDVICGTCLEMGHGKEWLSQRTAGKAVLTATGANEPSHIDVARDRARTFEDDDVAPMPDQIVAPMAVGDDVEASEIDHVVTAKVANSPADPNSVNLASAASLFSALGKQPSSTLGVEGEEDDLTEENVPQDPDLYQVGGSSTPFSPAVKRDGKIATGETRAAAPAVPSRDNRSKTAGRRQSTPSGVTRPSSSRLGAKSAKGSKSSSSISRGRSKAVRGKANNVNILVYSIISITVLTIIFAIVYSNMKPGPAKQQSSRDPSAIVRGKIKEAKDTAISALSSNNEAQLIRAKQLIAELENEVDRFKAEAKAQDKPLSEEEIDRTLAATDYRQTKMMGIPVRNALEVLHQQK
jgi:hypothetical protein